MEKHKWDESESRAFRDGCRRKAQTFTDKKKKASKNACREWRWS